LVCWAFALTFLNVIFVQFLEYMGEQFGLTGLVLLGLLLSFACQRVLKGLFESELSIMLKTRHGRTTIWAVGMLAVLALLFFIPVRSTTSGDFEVRPGNIVQVHVPVAGIVEQILSKTGAWWKKDRLLPN
jgi:multidrug efflux pump subunit AcrA (membrane-fusion protein)